MTGSAANTSASLVHSCQPYCASSSVRTRNFSRAMAFSAAGGGRQGRGRGAGRVIMAEAHALTLAVTL